MTVTEPHGGGFVPEWTLGERLRKARAYANLSVEDMAVDLGCTTKTIYNYEQDRTFVRLVTVKQWALRTGVALSWLVNGEDGPSPDSDGVTRRYGVVFAGAQDCDQIAA